MHESKSENVILQENIKLYLKINVRSSQAMHKRQFKNISETFQ